MQLFSFLKKDFVKNVLTLITGSFFSQVIIYGAILILVRLFSTELFGIYMLFSSVTLILKPLATLQYEFAVVLPKEKKDALNIFAFSLLCLLVFSMLSLIIILLFKNQITAFFNIEELKNFIYLIPLSVLLFGGVSIFDYWNNRTNHFKNISKGLVVKSVGMSSSQIAIGLSKFNAFGLIPGMLLGQFFQLLYLIQKSMKTLVNCAKEVSFSRMFTLAKKYKDIPVFNTIINVTNTISNELPVLLISKYFGLGDAGIYGLAIKFTKAPVNIIQQSVNQVFFNKASQIYNENGNLHELIFKTFKNLLLISVLVFLPLLVISFYLDVIFGENWTNVGVYARILIPWLFLAFLTQPITSLILILNRQKTILVFDIIMMVIRFLALFAGYYFYNSILVSLVLFSAAGMLFNVVLFFYLLSSSKSNKTAYS